MTIKTSSSDDQAKLKLDPEESVEKTKNGLLSYWGLDDEEDFILFDIDGQRVDEDKNWLETSVESGETLFLRKTKDRKILPEELWNKRIDGEINLLQEEDIEFDSTLSGSSAVLEVKLSDVPGPVSIGESLGLSYKHDLRLTLTREYPYRPPEIEWGSEIFHPNIVPPDKGGYVEMDYLSDWDFTKDISTLLENLEDLLMHPQMSNLCEHKSCRESAEIYKEKGFPEPEDRI